MLIGQVVKIPHWLVSRTGRTQCSIRCLPTHTHCTSRRKDLEQQWTRSGGRRSSGTDHVDHWPRDPDFLIPEPSVPARTAGEESIQKTLSTMGQAIGRRPLGWD